MSVAVVLEASKRTAFLAACYLWIIECRYASVHFAAAKLHNLPPPSLAH